METSDGFDGPPNVEQLKARDDVEGLIEALKYEDERPRLVVDIRKGAAKALGEIGDARAAEPLISAWLDYGYPGVQAQAHLAMLSVGRRDPKAVKPLVRALKHARMEAQAGLAEALWAIEGASAVEPLIQVLKDGDYYAQRVAARVLGEIGDARAVEPLIHAVKDTDAFVSGKAKDSLRAISMTIGKSADTKTVELLIQALKDEKPDVRSAAAEALGNIGDARAVEPLTLVLSDDKYSTYEATKALAKIKANKSQE